MIWTLHFCWKALAHGCAGLENPVFRSKRKGIRAVQYKYKLAWLGCTDLYQRYSRCYASLDPHLEPPSHSKPYTSLILCGDQL